MSAELDAIRQYLLTTPVTRIDNTEVLLRLVLVLMEHESDIKVLEETVDRLEGK